MDSQKELLKNSSSKQWRWRVCLGTIAALGAVHFIIGAAQMSLFWYSPGRWEWDLIQFSVPYILLLVAFLLAFGFALGGRVRLSIALLILAVVGTAGLFVFDVIVCERVQYLWGLGGEPSYPFWWWLKAVPTGY